VSFKSAPATRRNDARSIAAQQKQSGLRRATGYDWNCTPESSADQDQRPGMTTPAELCRMGGLLIQVTETRTTTSGWRRRGLSPVSLACGRRNLWLKNVFLTRLSPKIFSAAVPKREEACRP
jgi:hypothetical protein